jgi:hypothetical protein
MRTQLFVCTVFASALVASAQTLVIPQIADGGGWQTELVLTNTGTTATTVTLNFFQSTSGGATQNWTPPFLETSVLQNIPVPAASTVFLHTPGTAGSLSEGWAQVTGGGSAVSTYAIFTQTVPGRQNQDGTAPAAASTSRMLVPFDNTNGFVTTIAIVNTTASSESIAVSAQPNGGSAVQLSPITLPANGYSAFTLPQQFTSIASTSGLLEFYASSGSFSLIALRFNPTGAFTAAPVFPETGSPVITTGSVAAFNGTYSGTYSAAGISGTVTATVNNGTVTVTSPANGTGTVTSNGQTTFGTVLSGGTSCSFTGMFTVTSTTASASGTFSCTSPTVSGTWSVTRGVSAQ